MPRPPLPPFIRETVIQKVRLAEDGWNSRDAAKVASDGDALNPGTITGHQRTARWPPFDFKLLFCDPGPIRLQQRNSP